MFFTYFFWEASIFFQFRSVSVSISIIWHAGLFFRSYSGNLPAMFFQLINLIIFNYSRLRSNYCKGVFFMQNFRLTVLHFSSRIIFAFSSNFFKHFLILEWFRLLSPRNKVSYSNKTDFYRYDEKALIGEWLILLSKWRNWTQEADTIIVWCFAPIKKNLRSACHSRTFRPTFVAVCLNVENVNERFSDGLENVLDWLKTAVTIRIG